MSWSKRMRIDHRERGLLHSGRIETAGRKFKHGCHRFACHVEPLHDFFDGSPG